ncbi:MAG: synthase [Herbinix sp.]|jgi:CTP synthase (UTP-ammonia lyase)|nr:synthase [Herbinix sp.]
MNSKIRIGIIGDYDGRPSHLATDEAIRHGAKKLGIEVELKWLPTTMFETSNKELQKYNGIWCAPGSPYRSMNGALNAIKFARENNFPFLGTCGGFQHSVLEFGRNVLHISALEDTCFNPYDANDYITALSCSLIGQTRHIRIDQNSILHNLYHSQVIEEKYNCNFGLNKIFQNLLNENGFKVIGVDEEGDARIMILESNTFFLASLFQPQLSSTYENPHPLILEYLKAAKNFRLTF